jgi:hypothetical protein
MASLRSGRSDLPCQELRYNAHAQRALSMGRRRVNINEETERKAAELLLSLVPKDGKRVGNNTLSELFQQQAKKRLGENFGVEVYWQVRNALIEEGKLERGRGKGGSVRLIGEAVKLPKAKPRKYRKESQLYDAFHQTIQKDWVEVYDINDYVSEVSAHKGRKITGGKWTRPDVTLVSVGNYPFIPGKSVEVITFEIKPADAYGVEGVYEAASHSAFANKSYLALHMAENQSDTEDFLERLEKEAVRFGVGLVTFEDPTKWDTFEVIVEAQHKIPSPRDTNEFLSRLKNEVRQTLQKLLK